MQEIRLSIPDNASPAYILHLVATALTSAAKSVEQAAPAVEPITFPYLDPHANHLFKSREEYDDYWTRVAASAAQVGTVPAQSELRPGAVDVRTLSLADVEFIGWNINEFLQAPDVLGPTSALHALSAFLDYAIRDAGDGHVVPPDGFPQLAALTVDRAKAIRFQDPAIEAEYPQDGPARALLAQHRAK